MKTNRLKNIMGKITIFNVVFLSIFFILYCNLAYQAFIDSISLMITYILIGITIIIIMIYFFYKIDIEFEREGYYYLTPKNILKIKDENLKQTLQRSDL